MGRVPAGRPPRFRAPSNPRLIKRGDLRLAKTPSPEGPPSSSGGPKLTSTAAADGRNHFESGNTATIYMLTVVPGETVDVQGTNVAGVTPTGCEWDWRQHPAVVWPVGQSTAAKGSGDRRRGTD